MKTKNFESSAVTTVAALLENAVQCQISLYLYLPLPSLLCRSMFRDSSWTKYLLFLYPITSFCSSDRENLFLRKCQLIEQLQNKFSIVLNSVLSTHVAISKLLCKRQMKSWREKMHQIQFLSSAMERQRQAKRPQHDSVASGVYNH